jgi:antirestriction protein ArdC
MKNTSVERLYIESLESSMSHIKLPTSQVQVNKATGRNYRRLNQLILVAKQAELKSKSNEWVSKEQLEELGLQVKKGQFGTQLFSFKLKDTEQVRINQETGETTPIKEKVYSYYTVYNFEQLEKAQ